MATTVVKSIGTGGGFDYSTVQAWEDACPADLTATDEIWQGQLNNEVFSSTGKVVSFAGVTTDATRYIELTCQAGDSFADNPSVQTNALRYNTANGAAITGSSNYANASPVDVPAGGSGGTPNVHLTKLQILASGGGAAAVYSDISGTIVDRCILEGTYSLGALILNGSASLAKNSLILSRRASVSSQIANLTNGSSLYNCTLATLVFPFLTGVGGNYGSPVISNCAIFNVVAVGAPGASRTFTNCFSDDAAPPTGVTTTDYSTSSGAMFENIANGTHDFRIKSGSSLKDAGATDATYGPIDIAGTARPSGSAYDVGAWEYVVVFAAPVLSSATVSNITGTTVTPEVTITI